VETTGKLVVATSAEEVPGLRKLADRATANGVPSRLVTKDEARGYEPYVSCVEALRVETTGIIDYGAVCVAYAEDVEAGGGLVCLGTGFAGVDTDAGGVVRVRTTTGDTSRRTPWWSARACTPTSWPGPAGSSRRRDRAVPGEYFELAQHREHLVRGLIYPVPDPRFPFSACI
jgi:L-2-hydroxyglutarate oxidase